jgi:flagellar biosynthesis/type III secretory pathway chaperone
MEELLAILENGKEMLERLIQLAEEKRSALVDNRREDVAKLSQSELELTSALQDWEQARLQCAERRTLAELALAAEGSSRQRLLKMREELIFLTQKLANLNQQNADLLKHALAYTEYALSLIQPDNQTYGQQQDQGKLSFLDRKV